MSRSGSKSLAGCVGIAGAVFSGATVAEERGATTKGLQAMGGWTTLSQPENYTKTADLKRLAVQYMHLVEPERNRDESFPPPQKVTESGK